MLVLGVLFVLPVTGMVSEGFVVDGRFAPGAVLDVLARPRVHRVAWFTVWTSGVATLLAVVLGLPAAYALHRLALPGRAAVRAALLVPFVLPTVVVGVAFRQLLGEGGPLGFLGLDGTPVAIVCGLVFFNVAVVVRTVGVAWESLDPRPGQAAAALGASPWQVLRTVTLPALRPAIVGAASIVFLFCATAFGIVLTLGGVRHATVETEIYLLTTTVFDLQAAAALSVLQIVVVVGLLAARRAAARGPRPDGPAHRRPRARAVRRGDAARRRRDAAGAGRDAAADPHPGARLADASATAGGWPTTARSTTAGDDQALLVPVTSALATSLRTAVDATWMALLVGVAGGDHRHPALALRRRAAGALDPRRLLHAAARGERGDARLRLPDHPRPAAARPARLAAAGADGAGARRAAAGRPHPDAGARRHRRPAAAGGRVARAPRRWRTLLTVDLPVVWKPMLAASGFAFAASLGEFGATSFLARDDSPTLPVVIFRLIGHPGEMNYGMALAASVVLAATTAVVMLAVERLRVPGVGAF